MRIDAVELFRLALPLRHGFRSATTELSVREVLVLRVDTSGGPGWGECAALADPTYTAEYVDGAEAVLCRYLIPALLAASDAAGSTVAGALAGIDGHPMAKSALEMAVLDAELRASGISLATRLGGTRDRVEVGVAVGIHPSVGRLLEEVGTHVEAGYRRVKLKVAPGWDMEPVAAVRERFGNELAVQVDGNGVYGSDDLGHLASLDRFGLLMIEQPFAADDLVTHARLATMASTPVCLDESVTSPGAAATAIAMGACSVVNVKPGRVGGYLAARRVHDLCAGAGVALWCGGMLETGLGRAANLALASLPGFTLPSDISGSDRWYERDITAPVLASGGHMAVPAGPGIGVEPDPDALDDLSVTRPVCLRR